MLMFWEVLLCRLMVVDVPRWTVATQSSGSSTPRKTGQHDNEMDALRSFETSVTCTNLACQLTRCNIP